MSNLTKPIIHLNGDSPRVLACAYWDASSAIEQAIKKVGQTYPHLRNYYVHPEPQAGTKAMAEHEDRLKRLESVKDELNELARHCADFCKS